MKYKKRLKHILNIYQSFDEYPTTEDVLYELSLNTDIIDGKEFDIKKLKYILSFNIQNYNIDEILEELIDHKIIEKSIKNDKVCYKLLKVLN